MFMEEEIEERPTKIVSEEHRTQVLATVHLFDMTGNTHRHFMEHFVSHLQPRYLILVNGSSATHSDFRQIALSSCPCLRNQGKVLSPKSGESVELEDALLGFEITLAKTLFQSIKWKSLGKTQIARIEGALNPISEVKAFKNTFQHIVFRIIFVWSL